MDPRRPPNSYNNYTPPQYGSPVPSNAYGTSSHLQTQQGSTSYPISGSHSPYPGLNSPQDARFPSNIQTPTPSYPPQPTDPRLRQQQDPRLRNQQSTPNQYNTSTPPPAGHTPPSVPRYPTPTATTGPPAFAGSSNSTPIPGGPGGDVTGGANGDGDIMTAQGDSKARRRPLFCVVCASNNVSTEP